MKTRQYNNGDTCSVSANPGSHYTFDGWFENDSIVSSDNPYSFTVSGDRTLEGKFTANSYTITTNVSPVSGGSISGGGTYDYGDTCTLTATSNQGYTFATWTDGDGNFLSNDNPFSFTVSGDLTVRGVFGEYVAPPSILITTTGPASFTLTNSNNQTYTWVLDTGDNYYYGDEPGFALNEITGIRRVGANNTTVISADISELTSMTALSIEAFDTCKNLESIVLPDSLTTIEMNAFWGCNNLETINLPNSLTSIGSGAFANCTSLTSITLPNSITTIEGGAFGGSGLTSINLPNSITSIGSAAFSGCTNLTSITLPNSLTTLEYGLFQGSGLTSITIPSSITTWSSDVFYNCTSLESITIPEGITAIGVGSFDTCESLTSTTLPASLTSIGDYAFYGCISQESITSLATTPPTLGYDVFTDDSGCNIYVPWSADHSVYNSYVSSWSQYAPRIVEMPEPANLKITTNNATYIYLYNSIIPEPRALYLSSGFNKYYGDIPGFAINEIVGIKKSTDPHNYEQPDLVSMDASDLTSWTIVDQFSFVNCTNLTSITLPNTITTIGWSSFSGCTSLTSINFPNSLTTIGQSAFSDCTSLTSINLPNSLTTLGTGAFRNCTFTSITLPNSIATINNNTFRNCTNLTSITLPNLLTTIGNYAFSDCTSLTNLTLPNSLTTLGEYAFSDCTSLDVISIVMTDITTIEQMAFQNCTGLTSVYLDNNKLQTIGASAFYQCTSIDSIELPSTLTSIGTLAFLGCSSLTSITCLATTPPTLGNYAFHFTNDCPIYVPAASLSAYQSAWSEYASRLNAL